MAEWGCNNGQIVASLIGSGLIVTALTSWISDTSKPHINILIEPYDQNNATKIRHIFVNYGRSPATHVRTTMSYLGANITNNSTEYKSENVTLDRENCSIIAKQNCSSLVGYLPRLAAGAIIVINASIDKPVHLEDFPRYAVVATYDQGSNTYQPYPSVNYQYSPYNIQLLILLSILAAVFYAIALWHKEIKQARNHRKFVYHVLQDVSTVYTALTDKLYKDSFL